MKTRKPRIKQCGLEKLKSALALNNVGAFFLLDEVALNNVSLKNFKMTSH